MPPPPRKTSGRNRLLLTATISLAILLGLAWKAGVRVEHLAHQLRRLNWSVLAATLAFSAFWHVVVGAHKWWRILRAQGADVPYLEVLRVRWGSDPVRFVAPLKAGEIVNAAYFARVPGFGFGRAAGSIVFDKALNFTGTIFWLYVGVAAMAHLPPGGYIGLHTAMGIGLLLLLGARPVRRVALALADRVHRKLGRLAAGVLSGFDEFSPRQKIGFLLYGILFQIRPLVVCGLALAAFHPVRMPTVQELLALGSVVVLMSNIPSMGGIGPREATVMALFHGFADPTTLLSAGLLMSVAMQLFPAVLGIPLMFPLLRALAPGGEAVPEGTGSPEPAVPAAAPFGPAAPEALE